MRSVLLTLMVASLALPVGGIAARRDQEPPQQALDSIGQGICSGEKKKLGDDGFAKKYGAGDAGVQACVEARQSGARAIFTTCRGQAQPGSPEFKQCVQDEVKKLVQGLSGGGDSAEKQKEAVAKIASQVCESLQKKLGADKFAAKFGSLKQCGQSVDGTAQSLFSQCKSSGQPGTDAFKKCVQEGIKTAMPKLAGASGLAQDQAAEKIAGEICAGLQKKLGTDSFAKKFGSLEQCKTKLKSTAVAVASKCTSSGKPGSDGYKQCVQAGVQDALKKQKK